MNNTLRILIIGTMFLALPELHLIKAIWDFYPGKKSKKSGTGIERVLKGNKKMTAIILLSCIVVFLFFVWAIQNEFTRANSTVCTYYPNGTEIECHRVGFH
jgi:hypothetical protein